MQEFVKEDSETRYLPFDEVMFFFKSLFSLFVKFSLKFKILVFRYLDIYTVNQGQHQDYETLLLGDCKTTISTTAKPKPFGHHILFLQSWMKLKKREIKYVQAKKDLCHQNIVLK